MQVSGDGALLLSFNEGTDNKYANREVTRVIPVHIIRVMMWQKVTSGFLGWSPGKASVYVF